MTLLPAPGPAPAARPTRAPAGEPSENVRFCVSHFSNNTGKLQKALREHCHNNLAERISRDVFIDVVSRAIADEPLPEFMDLETLGQAAAHVYDERLHADDRGVLVREAISHFRFGFTAAAGHFKQLEELVPIDARQSGPMRAVALAYDEGGIPSPRLHTPAGRALTSRASLLRRVPTRPANLPRILAITDDAQPLVDIEIIPGGGEGADAPAPRDEDDEHARAGARDRGGMLIGWQDDPARIREPAHGGMGEGEPLPARKMRASKSLPAVGRIHTPSRGHGGLHEAQGLLRLLQARVSKRKRAVTLAFERLDDGSGQVRSEDLAKTLRTLGLREAKPPVVCDLVELLGLLRCFEVCVCAACIPQSDHTSPHFALAHAARFRCAACLTGTARRACTPRTPSHAIHTSQRHLIDTARHLSRTAPPPHPHSVHAGGGVQRRHRHWRVQYVPHQWPPPSTVPRPPAASVYRR